MKKIPTLFQRNFDGDRQVRDEVTPGCEWVIAGEGVATHKLDGTCCMVRDGVLYKRYELKKGRTPPVNFEPATDVDEVTGKVQGWVPVGDGPEDQYHREAFEHSDDWTDAEYWPDGTYELIGPKVQGGIENWPRHALIAHDSPDLIIYNVPRTFAALRAWLFNSALEGIVFHHPDGRMVKIKKSDFGFPREAGKGQL